MVLVLSCWLKIETFHFDLSAKVLLDVELQISGASDYRISLQNDKNLR